MSAIFSGRQCVLYFASLWADAENHCKQTLMDFLFHFAGLFGCLQDEVSRMKYWRGGSSKKQMAYEINPEKSKPGRKRQTLSTWSEFVMTLVWLRLGLQTQLLATIFGISITSVKNITFTRVRALHDALTPTLLCWPSMDTIRKQMPESFRLNFPNTRIIIDCTEIYILRPSDPDAQHKTYSSYKPSNTIKVLVGITPSGGISFVSKAWTGNISDKFITKRSGLIEKLEPGDHVMADRGFQIEDLLLPKGAKLIAPPFTRKCSYGKQKRLNASEILQTRKIARFRIHVERAIERMKRWEVLERLSLQSLHDTTEVIQVIAALCNLLPPLMEQ